jgi:hypothetical protein
VSQVANAGSFQSGRGRAAAVAPEAAVYEDVPQRDVATVPILALRPGQSPRLQGEDKAHIAWLAETESPLPPILVDRRSMRVIDGMHRLLAASLRGRETIEVEFFEGTPADAFLRAVEANVKHGLPLSQADRQAAAQRIVSSHPHLSDRVIAECTGLGAKAVAGIRRHSTGAAPQVEARVGRDGRVRPLDGLAGRRRAAKLMAEHPRASLREVARAAGVSPATAADVRKRLARGEEPGSTPEPSASGGDEDRPVEDGRRVARAEELTPEKVLEKLLRDPSLRNNEQGRSLLRLLKLNAATQDWSKMAAAVPPHCAGLVSCLARMYVQMWLGFAQKLDERVRVIDPWAAQRANGRNYAEAGKSAQG